jgi:tetratricopeptide (TPR) repeat protein
MAVITIREQGKTETGFDATLAIEGNNYQITVSDPFKEKEEQELEWYFEDWLRYPILEQVKADKAAASVKQYGQELFKQVFQTNINAYSQYSQLRGDLSQVQIEIESITPEFHAIHWKALQDPDLPRPLSIDSILIRKSVKPAVIEARVREFPTVNLLVVTARPNADEDVGYRTISRPLVEAIRNAKLRVKIELLRPGTYEALARHLESKGSGYYHIVHFDVHGALKSYQDFQKGVEANRYIYAARYGRGKIEQYEGLKAFLALEGENKGEYDLVEASEIANLLTGKGIPVCILNACQSGKQLRSPLTPLNKEVKDDWEDNRETSLGSRLMNAGMQMVVAMSYSVTVTAAEIMMRQIYQHLFDNQDINQAIRLGRRELYCRKGRRAYYNTEIDLEDWLLPVTYCNGQVDFNLREFTPEEEEKYWLSLDSKYEFQQPTYSFVGRDLDILLIEKALLKRNILLLKGMGGTGKTTLLNYLREWWQVTNFAEEIFYFGYDVKAHTLQQIVNEIGKQIYNRFQAMDPTAQWRKLSQKLRTEAYILILDNLESVTGQPLTIQNTLDESAREEIKKFLASLVGGKTKVVLGSRISEQWLQADTFRDNIYQLTGLDAQARTDLAEKILRRVNSSKSLEEIKTDKHFQRLMKLLAGYPLAMEVVLANLKQQSPTEILEQLEKAEIDPGGEDKTNNIIKCIEYSYSNLSESAQKLLLCLSPFRGFIAQNTLKHYADELAKLEPFQDYDLEQLETAVNEAVNWGLLSPISQDLTQLLTIQPVLPYFLNTKLKEIDQETKEALQEGFKNHYQALANYYNSLLESKDSQERKMGIVFVGWEYENLYYALQICLAQQVSVYDIWYCLYKYLELISDPKEQLKLTQIIYDSVNSYSQEKRNSVWENDLFILAGNLANCHLGNKDYQQAKNIYQNALNLIPQLENIEANQKQAYLASTLHQLGILAQELKELTQARAYYQQALDIFIEYGDHHSQASTLHELGIVAQELREFDQARAYYQQALDIKIEYGDRYEQARTLHQLGSVAQEFREFDQARACYQQALDIHLEYGDRHSQASTLHELGLVAQEFREFDQARAYYQQALDIKIEYGDRFSQARTLHQLGSVAQEFRELPQARAYYQQALDIYIEYRDRHSQASTLHELGRVAQELREFDQARAYYQQALDIFIEYGDRYSQASTLHQLGRVAQELREFEQARAYYQQALDIFIEYGDHHSQASTLHQLGSVAQELREFDQARAYYQQALDIKIEYGDRYSQASTLHQLGSVAHELREFDQARAYYQQALDIYIEYRDRFSQASTLHQLGIVAQELRELPQARAYYQQALDIYIEYGDRLSQGRTLHQLGIVAQEFREFDQARAYYQQALDIYIEYRDRFSQASTLHQLGIVAQELRELPQARAYYQQALDINIEYGDRLSQGRTLHQLGIVAQEFREFDQAKACYQQALDINIEYGDRFSQASTYGQLGILAEELSEFGQAKSHYLQALGIFVEFENQHYLGVTISNLASLYEKTQDNSLLTEIAAILNMTEAEVKELFERINEQNQ